MNFNLGRGSPRFPQKAKLKIKGQLWLLTKSPVSPSIKHRRKHTEVEFMNLYCVILLVRREGRHCKARFDQLYSLQSHIQKASSHWILVENISMFWQKKKKKEGSNAFLHWNWTAMASSDHAKITTGEVATARWDQGLIQVLPQETQHEREEVP